MSKTVLLVDADILCFRASAAAEKRTVIVKHLSTGQEKEFTNRTAFRDRLKEKYGDDWKDKEQNYSYEDVQTAESLGVVLNNIKARLHILEKELQADKVILVAGGSENFRSSLPLPSKYKGSREDSIRPVHLSEARNYVKKTLKSRVVDGIEADDLLNILGYEYTEKGYRAIICSSDKDTAQSDGLFWYNWLDENPEVVQIPLIGDLWLTEDGKNVKGLGFKFFAYQMLAGDIIDNVRPFEVSTEISRYGKISVFKDLKELVSGDTIANKVVEVYKRAYPDTIEYTAWDGTHIKTNWEGMLDVYFKALYMLRSYNDPVNWRDYFKERGWNGN